MDRLGERERLQETLNTFMFEGCRVPEHDYDGLLLYVLEGIVPGSFLQAVLENDLKGAVEQADHINIHAMPVIVAWLYNFAPISCSGSKENVAAYAEALNPAVEE